jgi:DNA repair protein SbcC/Rad50
VTLQIAHVGLRNIRSYRSADLSLGPGTTLLSGDIGSGKTSLLYAIEMGLLGFAEVDPGYLIRHGAKEAEVSLTLTDGTQRWELRRRFARRARKGHDAFEPTESSLAVDGQRAAYSTTELRRRAIELIGFPDNPNPRAHSDVWRWAIYLAQERMRDVLDPDVETRMETVRKALGVEQYRLAGENARALGRALQERASDLAEQGARHQGIEAEADRWQRQETAARDQLAALTARERQQREELGRARRGLEGLESQRQALESARQAVAHQERLAQELERSIDQDRAAQQVARDRLARVETDRDRESAAASPAEESSQALDPLRARREKLVQHLASLEEVRGQASGVDEQLTRWKDRDREVTVRHQATLRELAKARKELHQLETLDPIAEPRTSDARTPSELASFRTQLEETRRGIDRRLAMAIGELHELAELVQEGVCPRCHRAVEPFEFESHRREQETLVTALQEELSAATEKLEAADASVLARLEYDRTRDRWVQLEARRSDLRNRTTELEAARRTEEQLMGNLTEERVALENRRKTLSARLEDVQRVHEELSLVGAELVRAEEQAQRAAARLERLAALERQIPELRTEIENRARSEAERDSRCREVRAEIERARGRLRSSLDLEDRWREARTRVEALETSVEGTLRDARDPHGLLAEASARLDEVARRLTERRHLEDLAAQLGRLSSWLDKNFRTAMVELERRRLQQGRLQFERRFAQYFAALVEDPALAARVDETFAPWVDIAGQPTPAEALSGGERTALALAFRLALGRTVRDAGRLALETLILDEPTEGFSQEQTLRMGDLLEGLGLPQVILVSHERQLEGIADRVVRVRKKDGVSFIEETDRTPKVELPATGPPEGPRPKPQVPLRRRKIRRLSDLEAAEAGDRSGQAR